MYQAAMTAGAILAILAFPSSPGVVAGLLAVLALVGAGFFLFTSVASRLPRKEPAVRIGEPFLDFTAKDWRGQDFAPSTIGGPFLLKFYRGHWCPYCVAELRRWEQVRPRLDALGVTIVTVSPDTVEETARLKSKLGLAMTMLSDESLAVADLYNLRHEQGFAPTPGKRGILRPLAIPTAILVDREGIVRWIDQTNDYRIRSDPDRVVAAVEKHLRVTA